MRYKKVYPISVVYCLALVVLGFCLDTTGDILGGFYKIITSQAVLITDYIELAGPGAACLNAALVTGISLLVLHLAKDPINGFTIAEVGLMSGFALFGKNVYNILPIFLGTWLYAKYQKQPFSKYAAVALLATSLAPLVSYMSMGSQYASWFTGGLVGIFIGFILPSLSAYTFKIQNGMNLYNMGFACGLTGMMMVPVLAALSDEPTTAMIWATGYNVPFGLAMLVLCLAFLLSGFFLAGQTVSQAWSGYRALLRTSGRAPSDYLRMFGPAPVLINMAVNGMVATGYILATGGDLNGPTLGGILTIIGFSAYGKHAFNMLPVMGGVLLGGIFFHFEINAPAVQLAALFGTTLAPFAGTFRWPAGVLAGFLHSAVVLRAGAINAGVNLYNNGLSGGLIAIVLYPTLMAIVRQRRPELQPKDLFEVFEADTPMPVETNRQAFIDSHQPQRK